MSEKNYLNGVERRLLLNVFLAFLLIVSASVFVLAQGQGGESDTEFTILETSCVDNGNFWFEASSATKTPSLNNCAIPGNPKTCCPLGFECIIDGPGVSHCENTGRYLCFDYKTQLECESASLTIIQNTIDNLNSGLKANFCGSSTFNASASDVDNGLWCSDVIDNCGCKWDVSIGECSAAYDVNLNCTSGPLNFVGACEFKNVGTTNCSDGWITARWKSFWEGTEKNVPEHSCVGGERRIPCRPSIALGYFTLGNLLIALIIIIIVYAISRAITNKRVIGKTNLKEGKKSKKNKSSRPKR